MFSGHGLDLARIFVEKFCKNRDAEELCSPKVTKNREKENPVHRLPVWKYKEED